MKEKYKYNLKSIVAGLVATTLGILSILADLFWWRTAQNLWISIGCSLIASGLVILLTAIFVERVQLDPLDGWRIKSIFATRAEINVGCETELKKAKHQVDIIAFGLHSFRTKQSEENILRLLKKGVNFRILTMDPECDFVLQREKEEEDSNIKNSIEKLVEWANRLNEKSRQGKIIIKGYSSMTLDFYWRADGILYVGPYWYGYDSQQTVTYKFVMGGNGFRLYTEYFDRLWNNGSLSKTLTKISDVDERR